MLKQILFHIEKQILFHTETNFVSHRFCIFTIFKSLPYCYNFNIFIRYFLKKFNYISCELLLPETLFLAIFILENGQNICLFWSF